MQWGINRADELGLEAFVESTDDGRALYAKNGFQHMNEFVLEPTAPEQTEELLKVQRDLYFRGHFMWRPAGGRFVEGETIVPWEKKT